MSESSAYQQIASYLNQRNRDPRNANNVREALAQLRANPGLIPSLVLGPLEDRPRSLPVPAARGASPPAATSGGSSPQRQEQTGNKPTSFPGPDPVVGPLPKPPDRARPSEIGMNAPARSPTQSSTQPPTQTASSGAPATAAAAEPSIIQRILTEVGQSPGRAAANYMTGGLAGGVLDALPTIVPAIRNYLGIGGGGGAQATPAPTPTPTLSAADREEVARNPMLQPPAASAASDQPTGIQRALDTAGDYAGRAAQSIGRAATTDIGGGGGPEGNPLLGPIPPTYQGSDATPGELNPPTPPNPNAVSRLVPQPLSDALETLTGGARGAPGSPVEEQPPPGTGIPIPPAVGNLGRDIGNKVSGAANSILPYGQSGAKAIADSVLPYDQSGMKVLSDAITDPRSYEQIVRILAGLGVGTQQSQTRYNSPGRTPRQPPANQ